MTSVAIIGCGGMGVRHAQAFKQCGAQVAWAVDVVEGRAAELSCQLNGEARPETDYREALRDAQVEAVDICLPHNLHEPVALAAAQAGKHVLCEKPLAATLEEADRMIETCQKARVVLMVAENERFSPLALKVRLLLDQGVIGKPALFLMTRQCYLTPFVPGRPALVPERQSGGGRDDDVGRGARFQHGPAADRRRAKRVQLARPAAFPRNGRRRYQRGPGSFQEWGGRFLRAKFRDEKPGHGGRPGNSHPAYRWRAGQY